MTHLEGQNFAGYEILTKLGQGGMGAVYKARQPLLNRIVALKVMAEQISSDPDYVARFIREAASAANLRHPNIVEVFTAGEQNGMYFMAMEFVEGESLRKRLDRLGRIPPQEAVAVTIYVAQALQHAWNKTKLIHRDIKPDNIFLSDAGEVKVGDLGLAKTVGSENTDLTQSGMMMGSPHYISPEQAQAAKDIDFRTDIYSLGCTLYHMLTGKTPYTGDSSMAVIMKHLHEPAPAIFKTWPQCPMPLGMLVGRMLAKDRAARPQSYEQLVAELFAVSEKLQHPTATASTPVTSTAAVTQPLATTSSAPTRALQPSAKPKSLKFIYTAAGAAAVVALAGLWLWSPWKTTDQVVPHEPQVTPVAGSAIRPSASTVASDAGWQDAINLLKLVELPKDAVNGVWKQHDGMFVATTDQKTTQLVFPYDPPAEYDYRVRFVCLEGEGIVQTLVKDGHQFSWMMGIPGGGVAGFENIAGVGISESPARVNRRPMVTPGTPHISLVEVRNDGLRGYLDGELLAQWKTDYRDMSVHGAWRLPDDKPVAIGTFKSSVQILAAEVREVTGKGKLTRAAPSGPINTPSLQVTATSSDAALKQLGSVYKNSVGAEMVYIPPGEFMLGSTQEEQAWAVANGLREDYAKREGDTPRKVMIKEGFWIGRTEVTVGQWKEFVAATGYKADAEKKGFAENVWNREKNEWERNVKGASWRAPGFDQEDNHPVCCVSWNDAVAFCEWATDRERKAGRLPAGQVVRLPTEAEWEYACRAGTQTKFWWGEAKEDSRGRLNWNGAADGFQWVSPVDSYGARGRNSFGLADTLGNVQEWCLDGYDAKQAHEEYYRGDPGGARGLRGGSFHSDPVDCRSARRNIGHHPARSYSDFGFRVVMGMDVAGGRHSTPSPSSSSPEGGILAPAETRVSALTTNPKVGEVFMLEIGKGVKMEVMGIPPGEFMQGSTKEEQEWSTHYGTHINYVEREGEQPRRTTLQHGFWIGRTELTVGQWKEFVAATGYQTTAEKQGYANYALRKGKTIGRQDGVNWKNPGFDAMPQDNHPVCCVTWNDAMAYCAWLTERERQAGRLPAGFVVRLPTEAEWEYACRAGTQSKFWWGESPDDGKGRLNRKGAEDGFEYVAPVDAFGARGRNKFGLADMLGNLCEFCLDDFDDAQAHGEYYTAQLRSHALRGASFNHEPGFTRCAIRTGNPAASACVINGFRLCVGVEMPAPATATRPSTFNLLPRIDLQRDAMSGTWFFETGALVSSGNVNVLLELPYEPPQEYDFEIEFTIEKTGSAVAQRLSKSDCCFLWVVGGYGGRVFGFDTVGERWANQNPTRRDLDLPVGRRNTSVVKVRNDHVSASLNGSEISKWKTDYRDLAMPPWWRPRDPSLLGVASFNGRVVFHRIEVREVTGKGMFTRSEPPPSPTVEAFQRIASTYTNAAGGEMVYIPPGEFMLGSTKEERAWATANGWPENVLKREGEQPRRATIKQGFWMGRTEVTVGQWKKFVSETHYITDGEKKGESSVMQKPGNRPVDVKGASWKNPHFGFRLEDNHPVCCVSWNDAAAFCRWLTDQERRAKRLPQGCEVRLPTEAEWEYACRAGSQDKCWWGDNPDDGKGRLNWDGKEDGFEYVAPVDSFGARGRNRFGLADMLGNVFEWCLDGYDPTQAHADAWADNTNARVLRGGAFDMRHESCRCAWRHSGSPSSSGCARGFRVVVAGAVFCQKPSLPPASPAPASQGTNDTFSQNAINLLPLIDPQKDAVEGEWTLTDGALSVASGNRARVQIPYRPSDEYDLRVSFTRRQGNDAILQFLSAGGRSFFYCLSGWRGAWAGFGLIRNKQVCDGPSSVHINTIENGRNYTSLVQVRKDGVRAFLDDRLVTEWKTDYQDMSSEDSMRMRDEQSLGLGANQSAMVFHRIEVREITGKGTFTRGGSSRNTDSRLIGNVYTNAVGGEMVAIPPGEFLMGSTPQEQAWAAERITKPQVIGWEGAQPRRTAIKSGFWMGRTEVTVGQFKQFVQATGYRSVSETRGVGFSYHRERQRWDLVQGACWRDLKLRRPTQDNDPATCIEWSDAAAFCDWLNEREQAAGRLPTGYRVRLPTEAEWEYACRAGTQTKYWWGDDEQDGKGRLNWLQSNSAEDFPEVVDHYGPRGRNRFGLADILGNAREWCLDGFDPTGAHEQPCLDNTQGKVGRGGSFGFNPPYVRCASRDGSFQGTGHARQGFRVCCGVDVPGGRTGLPPATSAAEAAYFNEVAALPAEQQVARVVEELKKRNPGYDGKKTHKIQDGKVIELELWTEHISDISPVRSLSSLQNFYCTGPTDERNRPTGKKGMLADLSPLKGMHLTRFKCRYNHISDLSSLAGMAINYLESECNGTVCDLSPLERMPLTWLRFDKHLLQQGRNREILRNIRTLERINGIAAAEFWKKADTGEVPKP